MASAGTVEVSFAAETAKFTAELKKVQNSLNKLEGNFKSVEKVASFALRALTTGALISFAKQAFNAADATATAAERAGIAVESFSRLQYAAGQADVEMGALTTGIQRFQVAISNASAGSKAAQSTLAEFGLQAEKLSKLGIEQQLGEVADAFSKIPSSADRTRLAVELFGKSAGPQLVPLLAQGREGIAKVTKAADDLGITMSATTAAGIDQADQAIKTFLATLQGAAQKSLGTLSIALLGPPNEVVALEKQIESLKQQRDEILYSNEQGVGAGFAIYRKRIDEINAVLPQLESRLKSIQQIQAGIDISGGPDRRTLGSSAVISEIDIAAIQAMKIEVDDLALAYKRLATATAEVQIARNAEVAGATADLAAEAQKEVEQQITNDLEFQLQARSAMQSQYREQQYQQDIAYSIAREKLEQNTLSNVLGAMQSFAGQSESVAIALVAIQKAQALAQTIQLGQVAIMQAAASAPPPYNAPAIAWAKALTAISIASILASGYGQVRQIRSNGGAPIGSPVNPVNTTTQPDGQDAGAESQRAVQVIIANNVGFDQRVTDQIIAAIREATDDRDVIVFGKDSRQAQELLGG